MKYFKYVTHSITWLYTLDRKLCGTDCRTNRFFTTMFLYLFIVMGYLNAGSLNVTDDMGLMDAIVMQMPAQTIGLGVLMELMVFVESMSLCGSFENIFIRTVIVYTLAFLAYVFGVVCPGIALAVLMLICVCYTLSTIYFIALCIKSYNQHKAKKAIENQQE